AAGLGRLDQTACEGERPLTNSRHANLADDLIAGARRVPRGNIRRTGLEALDTARVSHGPGRELERRRMSGPADHRRPHLVQQILTDVKVSGPGATAQPFHGATDGEVGAERLEVHWN